MKKCINIWKSVFEEPNKEPNKEPKNTENTRIKELEKELADSRQNGQSALDQLKAIEARADLTEQERKDLQEQIKDLNSKLKTKDELAAEEIRNRENAWKTKEEELSKKATTWERLFRKTGLIQEISDAAVKHDANISLLRAVLKDLNVTFDNARDDSGKVKVDDDGDPIFFGRVKIKDKNEKGEEVVLDLSVDQATERMKKMPQYRMLFNGKGSGGSGDEHKDQTGKINISELAKDPEAYRKARKDGLVSYTN